MPADIDGGDKGGRILGMACRNAPSLFDLGKGVFHQMTLTVQVLVVLTLIFAVFAGWHLRLHVLRYG